MYFVVLNAVMSLSFIYRSAYTPREKETFILIDFCHIFGCDLHVITYTKTGRLLWNESYSTLPTFLRKEYKLKSMTCMCFWDLLS